MWRRKKERKREKGGMIPGEIAGVVSFNCRVSVRRNQCTRRNHQHFQKKKTYWKTNKQNKATWLKIIPQCNTANNSNKNSKFNGAAIIKQTRPFSKSDKGFSKTKQLPRSTSNTTDIGDDGSIRKRNTSTRKCVAFIRGSSGVMEHNVGHNRNDTHKNSTKKFLFFLWRPRKEL